MPYPQFPMPSGLSVGDAEHVPWSNQASKKLNAVVNVQSDFNAIGDGTANDSTQINAAITALGSAGGIVLFPPGTFLAANVTLKSKVVLQGAGMGATTLKLPNTSNVDLLKGENFATLTTGSTTGGISQWGIRDLALDGNKANNLTAGWPLRFYGYDFFLENVRVRNGRSGGIYSQWAPAGTIPAPDSMEAFMHNVKVHECSGYGIHWHGPHDSHWQNVIVYENTGRGVFVDTRGGGLKASACHSWGNAQNYGWYLDSSAKLLGCEGEGAQTAQVLIRANDTHIEGGTYYAAGSIAAPVGIEIANAAAGCFINTHILGCTSGALKFTSDGGLGLFRALVYQASGAAVVGTPATSNTYDIAVWGGGTGGRGQRYSGAGSPESVVTAPVGAIYTRTDGGATTTLYIKTSGTNNLGWTAK